MPPGIAQGAAHRQRSPSPAGPIMFRPLHYRFVDNDDWFTVMTTKATSIGSTVTVAGDSILPLLETIFWSARPLRSATKPTTCRWPIVLITRTAATTITVRRQRIYQVDNDPASSRIVALLTGGVGALRSSHRRCVGPGYDAYNVPMDIATSTSTATTPGIVSRQLDLPGRPQTRLIEESFPDRLNSTAVASDVTQPQRRRALHRIRKGRTHVSNARRLPLSWRSPPAATTNHDQATRQ